MDRRKTIENLIANLERLDSKEIVKLFTANATVHTPFREGKPSTYYPELLGHTRSLKFHVHAIYQSVDHPDQMALSYSFDWHIQGQTIKNKESVSLYKFEPHSDKIAELTVLYDASDMQAFIKTAIAH